MTGAEVRLKMNGSDQETPGSGWMRMVKMIGIYFLVERLVVHVCLDKCVRITVRRFLQFFYRIHLCSPLKAAQYIISIAAKQPGYCHRARFGNHLKRRASCFPENMRHEHSFFQCILTVIRICKIRSNTAAVCQHKLFADFIKEFYIQQTGWFSFCAQAQDPHRQRPIAITFISGFRI